METALQRSILVPLHILGNFLVEWKLEPLRGLALCEVVPWKLPSGMETLEGMAWP